MFTPFLLFVAQKIQLVSQKNRIRIRFNIQVLHVLSEKGPVYTDQIIQNRNIRPQGVAFLCVFCICQ